MSTRGPIERLERFWLAPLPVHGLVAARVILGASLAAAYLPLAASVPDLFGPQGLGGAGFHERVPEAGSLGDAFAAPLDLLSQVPSEAAIWTAWALLVAAALAFALGAWTRVAGSLLLVLHVLFLARNAYVFTGWALWVTGPLLYTVLGSSGRLGSLDAWRRRRRGAPEAPPCAMGWPVRLLQIHTCAMYVTAGWSRLDKQSWLAGDIVRIALESATHGRFVGDWSAVAPLLVLGTWASLALEAVAPIALWIPALRRPTGLALVALHAALAASMNIGFWTPAMWAGLSAFLLPWRSQRER